MTVSELIFLLTNDAEEKDVVVIEDADEGPDTLLNITRVDVRDGAVVLKGSYSNQFDIK